MTTVSISEHLYWRTLVHFKSSQLQVVRREMWRMLLRDSQIMITWCNTYTYCKCLAELCVAWKCIETFGAGEWMDTLGFTLNQ